MLFADLYTIEGYNFCPCLNADQRVTEPTDKRKIDVDLISADDCVSREDPLSGCGHLLLIRYRQDKRPSWAHVKHYSIFGNTVDYQFVCYAFHLTSDSLFVLQERMVNIGKMAGIRKAGCHSRPKFYSLYDCKIT